MQRLGEGIVRNLCTSRSSVNVSLYGDHLKQACMKEFESHNFRDPSPSQRG